MGCKTNPLPGGVAIICSRGSRRERCQTTGCTGESVALCDYPVTKNGKAGTCDRRMCKACRRPQAPEVDYCPPHARVEKAMAKP